MCSMLLIFSVCTISFSIRISSYWKVPGIPCLLKVQPCPHTSERVNGTLLSDFKGNWLWHLHFESFAHQMPSSKWRIIIVLLAVNDSFVSTLTYFNVLNRSLCSGFRFNQQQPIRDCRAYIWVYIYTLTCREKRGGYAFFYRWYSFMRQHCLAMRLSWIYSLIW